MSKHTPGPLRVQEQSGRRVYMPGDYEIVDQHGGLVASVYKENRGGDESDLDNANILAAAPDLLAACEAIVFQVYQGKVLERDACISQARAAITKAKP